MRGWVVGFIGNFIGNFILGRPAITLPFYVQRGGGGIASAGTP
jgi:hypothetical protein